ncbi:hypothetical protein K440DRAFT_664290 [Wilcoxina mikolae CBS 423.85]|nr:hypothetical protein K440DRAFT_664290 [Wilcoxina mikolae CBS 423.85]
MDKPLVTAFLIVVCAISVANARSIEPAGPGQKCGFQGNSDMYGLGIRCGVYIQAFATTLSGAYRQESARGISFANGFFQFAMFVALVYMTVIDNNLEVVEAAIVILFTFCSVSISNPEDEAFQKPDNYDFPGIRNWLSHSFVPFGKMVTDLALNLYWTWFWFVGIERLTLSPCTGYGFFFAKVSLFGWFRMLASIITIIVVVLDIFFLIRVLKYGKPYPDWVERVLRRDPNRSAWLHHLGDFLGLLISLAIVGFYILSVELMILWNSITGVSTVLGSVGQMIPFLVGMGSLIAVILEWDVKPRCDEECCKNSDSSGEKGSPSVDLEKQPVAVGGKELASTIA